MRAMVQQRRYTSPWFRVAVVSKRSLESAVLIAKRPIWEEGVRPALNLEVSIVSSRGGHNLSAERGVGDAALFVTAPYYRVEDLGARKSRAYAGAIYYACLAVDAILFTVCSVRKGSYVDGCNLIWFAKRDLGAQTRKLP